jgi:hypothetical protein
LEAVEKQFGGPEQQFKGVEQQFKGVEFKGPEQQVGGS